MGTVATLLAENVSFRCTSVDRIGIRGYIPGLQYEGGVLRFLIERGCRIPSPAGLTHNHDRLVSELDALVAAHDVAVVRFKRDECKEDIARPYQLAAAAPTARARAARAPRPSGRPRGTLNAYAPIALAFEPTGPGPRGDLHRPGAGYGIGLTRTGATLALSQGSRRRGAGSSGCRPWGADPAPAVAGADLLAGRANCLRLRGPDPSAWINDIPTYGEVASQGVYPGVDCGDQRQLEYDLVVAPGADPSRIQVLAEGGGRVKLDPKSHLTMTGAKSLGMGRRVAYQIVDGVRQAVEGVLRPQPQQRGWASSWAPTTPPSPWSSTRSSAAPPSWAAPPRCGGGRRRRQRRPRLLHGDHILADFPRTVGAFQTVLSSGSYDAFIAKLYPTGAPGSSTPPTWAGPGPSAATGSTSTPRARPCTPPC